MSEASVAQKYFNRESKDLEEIEEEISGRKKM
jgi:hypothetical protein